MRHGIISGIVLFILFSLWVAGKSDFQFKKNLDVRASQVYPQSIVSLGGNVVINGIFQGTVILIGGQLEISGEIGEDVISFGSTIRVHASAKIKRDLIVIGGQLKKHGEARVAGKSFYFEFDKKKFANSLFPLLQGSQAQILFKWMKVIFWLLIALLLLMIFPEKTFRVAGMAEKNPLKTIGLGLLSTIGILILSVVFIMLSFFLIGIPLLIVLVLAYFIAFITGRSMMFLIFGRWIARKIFRRELKTYFLVIIGAVFYGLIIMIPFVSEIIIWLTKIIEIGIGVIFLFQGKITFKDKTFH